MTPKEKAIELVNKYWDLNLGWLKCCQCALIAVDEILNIQWVHSEPTCFDDLVNEYKSKSDFWNQVKQEIENL